MYNITWMYYYAEVDETKMDAYCNVNHPLFRIEQHSGGVKFSTCLLANQSLWFNLSQDQVTIKALAPTKENTAIKTLNSL